MAEKMLFWDQISEMEILMDLYVFKYLEFKNNIFSGWWGFARTRACPETRTPSVDRAVNWEIIFPTGRAGPANERWFF